MPKRAYIAEMLKNSRFNPSGGIKDFWSEFRKPNPWRFPILIVSTFPLVLMYFWLTGETVYTKPERPSITYITTLNPDRSDEEIIASNLENQEVKDLREEQREALEQRKRELYMALGAAAGMDVEETARRADEERAAEEAAEEARRAERFGRTGADAASGDESPSESSEP